MGQTIYSRPNACPPSLSFEDDMKLVNIKVSEFGA
jgi:hypothetical protein